MASPDAQKGVQRDIDADIADLVARLGGAREYLRIADLRAQKADLEEQAAVPELWDDPDRARTITTALGRVADDVGNFDKLEAAIGDLVALGELLGEAQGSDETELNEELLSSFDPVERQLAQLELRSLFSGEFDEYDAICEVHAGAGGTDSQDWAEMMLRMYSRWAERRGFDLEVDETTPGQEAGLLSATFIVHGRFAFGLLAQERGVHRLVRMSPFDSQHRRHTSFSSFDVVPFLEEVGDVEIDEKDLRIDTYRSSGAGGQHVNKTDSAVRLTHLPTGLVVAVQNQRSQHQNKAKAMQILAAKLAERERKERHAQLQELGGERQENAWGSQIRSYVLAPYQLVKDLRTGEETGNVEAVLDGDLDNFIERALHQRREHGAEGTKI
jgi:peptide chain release factor 2